MIQCFEMTRFLLDEGADPDFAVHPRRYGLLHYLLIRSFAESLLVRLLLWLGTKFL